RDDCFKRIPLDDPQVQFIEYKESFQITLDKKTWRAIWNSPQIGTLLGLGNLWDGDKDLGSVHYTIHVFKDGGLNRGEGTLEGAGYGQEAIFKDGKRPMLRLKTGKKISNIKKSPHYISIGKSRHYVSGEVLAKGPIPDPIDGLDPDD